MTEQPRNEQEDSQLKPDGGPGAAGDSQARTFKCRQCGAKMQFQPGSLSQKCPYCGRENPIPQSEEDIRELDFRSHLQGLAEHEDTVERLAVVCGRRREKFPEHSI